ncbi:hypothetical protein PoB_002716400 [Plakobranchus ocellatus]|uniref:Uncharacterized protein n=1 Tax=Plakobranchus ocellatus TaxID=259542 RepID=A0AAV4A389_9GAST|nr:hypothetical protein PoB_002716400 [Plakobranchus ocellatus]
MPESITLAEIASLPFFLIERRGEVNEAMTVDFNRCLLSFRSIRGDKLQFRHSLIILASLVLFDKARVTLHNLWQTLRPSLMAHVCYENVTVADIDTIRHQLPAEILVLAVWFTV